MLTIPEEISSCRTRVLAKAVEVYKILKETQSIKLLSIAKMEFEKGNFMEGVNLIQKIEPGTTGFAEGQNLIKLNQDKWCKQLVLRAKASLATKDYLGAAGYLKVINPESSCSNEALELLKEIDSKMTAEEKQNWEFKQKQYQDQVNLKKEEINCLKEIAVEYVKSQPKTATYNTIIK